MKADDCLSAIYDLISGVLQGSVCGPGLYTLLVDSLLRKIGLRNWCFADDFKFIADVTVCSQAAIQDEIDAVVQWSDERNMPLSEEKCGVMHCGNSQPNYTNNNIRGKPMTIFDSFKDSGVLRSIDRYEGQCHAASVKASRTASAIRWLFQINSRQLLWPAFKSYVLPTLMYCSQAWNPLLVKDIDEVKRVQRRFTECICGMYEPSYEERLHELGALSRSHQTVL